MASRGISELANAALRSQYANPVKVSRFVDAVRVRFSGGKGGDGSISFLHLFANEFAGPDGGNGGNGGHLILRAENTVKSLNHVKSHYMGEPGERGQGKNLYGKGGEHKFIDVPVGTIVRPARPMSEFDYKEDESDIIADLDEHGSMFIAARGGGGGKGNMSYLSNRNRHPRQAQAGARGDINVFELKMRLYAHLGLIGMPNAGKSTLLRALTMANVRIGEYAFTTLHPQVGTIEYDDYSQVAISDLPGLIQDSHLNRGLGVQFLRHVERCACIVFVIDLSSESPIGQIQQLVKELEAYKKGLSSRPNLIVGNKIDTESAQRNEQAFATYVASRWPNTRFITVSTLTGANLKQLRDEFKRVYDFYASKHAGDTDALVW